MERYELVTWVYEGEDALTEEEGIHPVRHEEMQPLPIAGILVSLSYHSYSYRKDEEGEDRQM